jgi:hypothetical protein
LNPEQWCVANMSFQAEGRVGDVGAADHVGPDAGTRPRSRQDTSF